MNTMTMANKPRTRKPVKGSRVKHRMNIIAVNKRKAAENNVFNKFSYSTAEAVGMTIRMAPAAWYPVLSVTGTQKSWACSLVLLSFAGSKE